MFANFSLFSYKDNDVIFHVASLLSVAHADDILRKEEESFVTQVAASYSTAFASKSFDDLVRDADPITKKDVEEWQKALAENPVAARNLIKDMIGLGLADKDFCDAERREVSMAATRLKVPQEVVLEIEKAYGEVFRSLQTLRDVIKG